MVLPPVIFLGLAVLFFIGMQREDPDGLPSAILNEPAPALQLTAFGSEPVLEDADLRDGDVKLVNYWASWCGPCRAEHPNLELLADEGITIYGVNYKDQAANASAFLEELGNPYAKIGVDANGRTALNWGLYGVPETYVIDGDGNVALRFAGPITQRVLDTVIRPAIEGAR